ncbi:hypothetical protein GUITHDRAFT_54257, partial [Guillardia theta CCMP2712]
IVTSISPTKGSARGSEVITVHGSGFSMEFSYVCKFGSLSVKATVMSLNELICLSPT